MKILNKKFVTFILALCISTALNAYAYHNHTQRSYRSYDNNKRYEYKYPEQWHRFPAAWARYQMGADPYLKPSFSDIPEQPNISGFEQESYNSPK